MLDKKSQWPNVKFDAERDVELDAELDALLDTLILKNNKQQFIEHLRTHSDYSLKQILDELYTRYARLRDTQPKQFVCSHAEYWAGYYS